MQELNERHTLPLAIFRLLGTAHGRLIVAIQSDILPIPPVAKLAHSYEQRGRNRTAKPTWNELRESRD